MFRSGPLTGKPLHVRDLIDDGTISEYRLSQDISAFEYIILTGIIPMLSCPLMLTYERDILSLTGTL
jgi:hypothetical protein